MNQLSPLTLITPPLPPTATTLSVDMSGLPLTILADTNTLAIDVTVGPTVLTLASPTRVNGQNQFTGSAPLVASSQPQVVQITGLNYTPRGDWASGTAYAPFDYVIYSGTGWVCTAATSAALPSNPTYWTSTYTFLSSPLLQFDVLYANSGLATSFGPPSGISISKGVNACTVQWALPTYTGFQGVRVQWSTDASGVNIPYQQYGGVTNTVSSSAEVPLSTLSATSSTIANPTVAGNTATNTTVATTTTLTATTEYGSISIPATTVGAQIFYIILTALVQDPITNMVYESQAAGPFLGGFVDLSLVKPTDFLALQQSQDIAARMISEITRRRPDLDLTARAEIRDIIINPLSMELATMSIREWFSRCCQAISALVQIDDANGDGVSDPVSSSSMKQQIARAYGLSATDVQTFIDGRFDILGEGAGIQRGGATASTVNVTFYTYSIPATTVSFNTGMTCSTIPDTSNPTAITFTTLASATFSPANAAAYFDPSNNWYAVSIPAQATTTGASTNVGAESITQIASGGPSGFYVTNMAAARYGQDQQSNIDYAVAIRNRQVVGKDTGTRNGYWESAMKIPGVMDTLVVASGDLDMLRDWSSIMQKHTFGTVDIYVQGNTSSQQTEYLPFTFPTPSTYGVYSTYQQCSLVNAKFLSFKIGGFPSLPAPIYTAVEMVAVSGGTTVHLGTANSQFDNVNGLIFLNPNDQPFLVNADGTTAPWQINGKNTTNKKFIAAVTSSNANFYLMVQLQAGIQHVPALQPVTAVNAIYGPQTGVVLASNIELVHTTDFLLTGGSTDAGDVVSVSGALTSPNTANLTLATATTVIGSNIAVQVDANGNPEQILSLLSADLSTLYECGVDYSIVAAGPYRTYAIQILPNSSITPGPNTKVVAGFYQYNLIENINLCTDSLTLVGSTPTSLSNQGFIHNTWMPGNHGITTLLLDGAGPTPSGLIAAGVPPANRYIKVSLVGTTTALLENSDFTLAVDPSVGAATLTRVMGGAIPDGGTVTVEYLTNEVITVSSEYPAYVEQVSDQIAQTQHAGADTLVKAMIPSGVDLVMNVVLNSATSPASIDGTIRTTIDLVVQGSSDQLYQSEIIGQVQGINGVTRIGLPLLKCAKSDGSYDIARVIPTGTSWLPLASDTSFGSLVMPTNSYISAAQVLPYPTVPSGGTANNYVGLLHEGQPFRRAASVQDFLTSTVPSFYIIGTNDQISPTFLLNSTYSQKILLTTPNSSADPALLSFFATYQVFGAASSDDIEVASPEYLSVGTFTINYLSD